MKYFCGFFDTPGVPGGVLIVKLEMSILLLLPNTYWTQIEETSHCVNRDFFKKKSRPGRLIETVRKQIKNQEYNPFFMKWYWSSNRTGRLLETLE